MQMRWRGIPAMTCFYSIFLFFPDDAIRRALELAVKHDSDIDVVIA